MRREIWITWADAPAIVQLDEHAAEIGYFIDQGWLVFDGVSEWRLTLPRSEIMRMLLRGFEATFNHHDRYGAVPKEAQ